MRTLLLLALAGCEPPSVAAVAQEPPDSVVINIADSARPITAAKAKAKRANRRADDVIRRLRELPEPPE